MRLTPRAGTTKVVLGARGIVYIKLKKKRRKWNTEEGINNGLFLFVCVLSVWSL